MSLINIIYLIMSVLFFVAILMMGYSAIFKPEWINKDF
jgi:hypothetical protein